MAQNYRINVSEAHEDQEWDDFVATTTGGSHVQTSAWAQVKAILGWQATRIYLRDECGIVGGAQILFRSLPVAGSIGYVTKGPLCSHENPLVAKLLLQEILGVSRQKRCRLLAVQPPNNGNYVVQILETMRFSASDLDLAATASVVIELEHGPEKILAQMTRETRRHIRSSEHAGVTVREGDQSDLDIFYALHLQTASRQQFTPYQRRYFEVLWQSFVTRGWISLLVASYENEPVSAQLLVPFADTVVAKTVGWTGTHSRHRPNHALYWASIRWAIERGYRYFDFEGVDPVGAREIQQGKKVPETACHSHDIIKYSYGGKVFLYPGTLDYIPNKLLERAYRGIAPLLKNSSACQRLVEYLRKRP